MDKTETIWHHQTAELPPVTEHPHRRRVLASLYSGCGVLGLLIGVTVAELHAAPPLIPPSAVASHGVSGPLSSTSAAVTPTASTAAKVRTLTSRVVATAAPVHARSARVVADDPTTEPTTDAPTETPTAEPTVDTPHMTATKSGPQGMPTGSPTPSPSEPPMNP